MKIDLNKLLHGEQGIEIVNPLPKAGKGFVQSRYIGIYDVGKASIFENETVLTDESGKVLAKLTGSSFIRDAGGWGGPRPPARDLAKPDRAPDFTFTFKTGETQAQLYRLSGDYNPLVGYLESDRVLACLSDLTFCLFNSTSTPRSPRRSASRPPSSTDYAVTESRLAVLSPNSAETTPPASSPCAPASLPPSSLVRPSRSGCGK